MSYMHRPINHQRQGPSGCIRACLAMLLDKPQGVVLSTLHEVMPHTRYTPWPRDALEACRILDPPGAQWELFTPPITRLVELGKMIADRAPGEPFVAFVRLPRGKRSVGHAVLVRDNVLHDPEMSGPTPLIHDLHIARLGHVQCLLMRAAAVEAAKRKGPV